MRELHVLRFVFKQRIKKISEKYKLAFSIIFDKTTLIYIGIAGIIGLFVLMESVHYYSHYIQLINKNNDSLIIYFLVVSSLFYFFKGFLDPRYKVTTSDYNLNLITYDIDRIIKILVINQQIKRVLIMSFLTFICYLLKILNLETMILFIIFFSTSDIFTGIIQWRNFQRRIKSFLISVSYISILFGVYLYLYFLTDLSKTSILALLFILLIILILIQFKTNISQNTNWNEVIIIGDDKTWNLLIVKLITGVGFNFIPHRLRTSGVNKKKVKETSYTLPAIITRYWKNYFIFNKNIPFTIITNCIAVLIFFNVSINAPSGLSLALSTLIYMYWLYEIFKNKLDTIQFKVLPFSIECHIRGFYFTTSWMMLTILLVHSTFKLIDPSISNGLVIFIILSEWLLIKFIFTYLLKYGAMDKLNFKKMPKFYHLFLVIFYSLLLMIIESIPIFSFIIILIIGSKYLFKLKNNRIKTYQIRE